MRADTIIERLTARESEEVTDRFVRIMGQADTGRLNPRQTVSALVELYRDAVQWVTVEHEKHAALPLGERAPVQQEAFR